MEEPCHSTPGNRARYSEDSGYLTTSPSPVGRDAAGWSSKLLTYRKRDSGDAPLVYHGKLAKTNLGKKFLECSLDYSDQHDLSNPFLTVQNKLPESTPILEKCSNSLDISVCSTILKPLSELQVSSGVQDSEVSETSVSRVPSPIESKSTRDWKRFDLPRPIVQSEQELPSPSSNTLIKASQKENSSSYQAISLKRKRLFVSPQEAKYPRKSLIGLDHVDFLVRLNGGYELVLSKLFSYMQPEDMVRMSLVSRAWYRICCADKKANSRRLAYVKRIRYSKENLDWRSVKSEASQPPSFRAGPFREIQNVTNNEANNKRPAAPPKSPPVSPTKIRHRMFVKAGGALETGGRLVPCPRCQRPSHIQPFSTSAQCSAESCRYTFCILCFCDCHDGQSCSSSQRPPPAKQHQWSVGSAKSKRNLRRL